MKYLMIFILSLTFISCASQYNERVPASDTAEGGITAEAYGSIR